MSDPQARIGGALAGRYTLAKEVGRGGMAIVFSAQDLKHHRSVAIKVLRPELTAVLGSERFLREIEIAAALSHPHILPLYDSGDAQGFLYYVMPLVESESLRDRLAREGQLSIEESLQITNDVAEALAYAHSVGIVHRDIKPENILFLAGHAVLTDFGIAKAVTEAAVRDNLTQAGVAVGTPAYMSPEQASGDRAIDGRSDLYSLGCVLFEMLAGEPPFTGPTVQAVIAKRFALTPPEMTKLRAGVSMGLSQVIAKLLAQTPADRYSTAAQLLQGLKLAGSVPPMPFPKDQTSVAVLPFANLSPDREDEYFSDGITEEIINALSRVEGLHVASRTSSFSFKGHASDVRAVSAKLRVKHVLEGSIRRAGSRLRIAVQFVDVDRDVTLWSERYDREINDIFAVQDEIAKNIAARLQVTLSDAPASSLVEAGTTNVEAYEEYLKGRHFWNQRGPGLVRAVQHFRRAIELDAGFVAPYAGLADSFCIYALYGLVSQEDAYMNARDAVKHALALDPGDADVQYAAALVELFFAWNLERGEEHLRSATRINPRHARAWAWLAQMNGYLGRIDGVREAVRRAHQADPLSPLINGIAGQGLLYIGCYEEAIRCADEVLDVDANHLVPNWLRGYCYIMLGRTGEAVDAYEIASASWPSAPALSGLAAAYACAGRTMEARAVLARIAEITGGNHPRGWECLPLVALGCIDEAVDVACMSLGARHWIAWGIGCQPMLESITEHPRWRAAMKEVGLEWVVDARLRHNASFSVDMG